MIYLILITLNLNGYIPENFSYISERTSVKSSKNFDTKAPFWTLICPLQMSYFHLKRIISQDGDVSRSDFAKKQTQWSNSSLVSSALLCDV